MRLFVAVPPPPDVVAHLEAVVQPLRDDVLRWTVTDAWHLTLAFYGEVADRRVDDLEGRLARAARRHPAVSLRLTGAGRFGGRALWIGCTGDTAPLRRLAASAAAAGRRVGARADERRSYRPHLTMARASRPVDLRPYVTALREYEGVVWTADGVALIRSYLGAGEDRRARYETLSTFALRGAV
ncbi:MAG: RNA 2',3'-cyclic phosphodiesterase [Jiangellaceae bacterium]